MAKLGRPIKKERPQGYYELAEKVYAGEITEIQAAEKLGMSREWFRQLLKKDFPGRPKVDKRQAVMRRVGQGNRRFQTILEERFPDAVMCRMISREGSCAAMCPLVDECGCECKCKGLVKALLVRVPLKKGE